MYNKCSTSGTNITEINKNSNPNVLSKLGKKPDYLLKSNR